MIFLAVCLLGGILVWVMSMPKAAKSTKSNEVAETLDVAKPVGEVDIVIPYDTIAKPKEVIVEPEEQEEQIEEPEKHKADTVVSPDGRYYMVFPIEGDEDLVGVYDSRTGKEYITFGVDEGGLEHYSFVENQDYITYGYAIDASTGCFYTIHIKDPSKEFALNYDGTPLISDPSYRYVAFLEFDDRHGELCVVDLATGREVLLGEYGYPYSIDIVGDYVVIGIDERTIVYNPKKWTKLLDKENIESLSIGEYNEKYILICYMVYEYNDDDGYYDAVYEYCSVYDKVTGKLFKTVPMSFISE